VSDCLLASDHHPAAPALCLVSFVSFVSGFIHATEQPRGFVNF